MDTIQSRGAAQRLAPVNALPVGARVQEYEIRSVIGEGGFGIVYRAYDTLLEREVAIKEYLPVSHATRRDDGLVVASSERQRETFEKGLRCFVSEARMLARFKHPALVEILRFWEEQGTAYMVMPFYLGRPLSELIQEGFRIEDSAGLEAFLMPLLDGLAQLHGSDCYHRDISTDNILMLENGQPLLLDFGAARSILVDKSDVSTVILKPGFAPIEQYSEDHKVAPQGAWTDLYALSAVAYQVVTGIMPTVSVARIIRDPLLPLVKNAPPGISPALLAAIDLGLRVSPDQRPQSVQAFLELMHAVEPAADERMLALEAVMPAEEDAILPASGDAGMGQQAGDRESDVLAGLIPLPEGALQESGKEVDQAAPVSRTEKQPDRRTPAGDAHEPAPAASTASPVGELKSEAPARKRNGLLVGVPLLFAALIGMYLFTRSGDDDLHGLEPAASPAASARTAASGSPPAGMPFALGGKEGREAPQAVSAAPALPEAEVLHDDEQQADAQMASDGPPAMPLQAAEAPEVVETPSLSQAVEAHHGAGGEGAGVGQEPPMAAAPASDPPMITDQPMIAGQPMATDPPIPTVVADAGGDEHGIAPVSNAQNAVPETPVVAEQQQGTVDVRVEPWGNVFVNGELVGVTPPRVRFQADPGQIEIEIRNETHPAKHVTLDIEAGRTYRIRHVFGND